MVKDEQIEIVRKELKNATPHFNRTKLYKMLKEELTRLGHWKNRGRGNPAKAYKASIGKNKQEEF